MKKLYLLMLIACFSNSTFAQFKLSGSNYQQNFNGLATGLPEGWDVNTNAKVTSIGGSVAASFVATPAAGTRWSNTTGAFKNVASANGFANFAAGTPTLQLAATDRALGVKQTGTFGDAGASFTFQIDNTFRLSDFKLDFKLQSLDSSNGSKVSTWVVQYAFGDTPKVFTTASSGTITTGGNTFSNILHNVNFASALDDKRELVWIRIVALTASTGSGSRTTTAIDDVELRWTGTATPSYRPLVQKLFPSNGSTDVLSGSILTIDFSRNISLGTLGSLYIKNETDNTIQTINAGSTFLSVSGKQLSIAGVKLDVAKTYHVTFDSSIVDTALATTFAIEDTTEWRFSTMPIMPYFLMEHFDTACAKGGVLPLAWTKYSNQGTEQWNCIEHATGNSSMRIYGNDGTVNTANEDWLISPRINLTAPDVMGATFKMYKINSGAELQVLVSQDYAGSGAPDSASWTAIPLTISAADVDKWMQYIFPIIAHKGPAVHFGFKYTSTTAAAYDTRIDSFMILIKTAVKNIAQNELSLSVIGAPTNNQIELQINSPQNKNYTFEIFNTIGQRLYYRALQLAVGKQNIRVNDIDLPSGMYILKMANAESQVLEKCVIR